MTTISLDNRFTLSKDAVFRDLDGEAVILDLGAGTYFGLNAVGARMWQLLGEHSVLRTVFDTLCREYDASPDVLERDLIALVSRLEQARLGEVK